MAWKKKILVVANITSMSDELLDALKRQAAAGACAFTLIVPATPFDGGRQAAHEMLSQALERLRGAGLEVDGGVGDGDPVVAVTEAWDPKQYDEIVVSTLPMRFSKWLHAGLPERVGRLTGAPVTHVISQPRHELPVEPAPHHEKEPMGPLSVLAWNRPKREH